MWKCCSRQAAKQTLKSGQEKQFVKACLFLIEKKPTTQRLSQIKLFRTPLRAEMHRSFLGVCVFTVGYKLLLRVDLYLTNHAVGSELMLRSWAQAGLISW